MFILLFIFIIIVSMFIMAAFLNSPGRLTPLKDTQGNIIPGSVSEKVWIDINGIKQVMFIRGEDVPAWGTRYAAFSIHFLSGKRRTP